MNASEQEPSEQEPSEQGASEQGASEQESSEQEPSEQGTSEQEPSEQEPSEQSEYSSEPTATTSSVEPESEPESKFEPQLEPSDKLARTSSSIETDEQILMGYYEKAAIQLIDNSLKRKDLTELDVICSAAKKCKPSPEMENGVAVQPMEGKSGNEK